MTRSSARAELEEQKRFSVTRLRRAGAVAPPRLLEDVNITTRKADREDRLDLVVDVKEASTGQFSAGAGISSGESFLFNVRLQEINLFGRGQRLVLNADFGDIRRNLNLSFTEPYFLDTELSLGFDAFNWELQFGEFTRGGTGGSIRSLYPFTALLDDSGAFAARQALRADMHRAREINDPRRTAASAPRGAGIS